MILGEEQPDAGIIRVGETVRISYVDQMRAGIDADKTVWEVVSGGEAFIRAGRCEIPSRAYRGRFRVQTIRPRRNRPGSCPAASAAG